jgi:hypothetical protein
VSLDGTCILVRELDLSTNESREKTPPMKAKSYPKMMDPPAATNITQKSF